MTFEIQLPRGEGIDIFARFNTATFISMLQTRTYISFLCSMIWGERWLFLLFILAGFVTRETRRISLVERFTLPEQLSSPPVFSGVHFARSFVFCVLLDRCLSVCPFSFGHCVVCLSSISGFWLPLLVSSNSYYITYVPQKAEAWWRIIYLYHDPMIDERHNFQ